MMNQLTIENPISCFGIGVHSGNKTQVTLRPASKNVGIVFIRTDVSSVYNKILANSLIKVEIAEFLTVC